MFYVEGYAVSDPFDSNTDLQPPNTTDEIDCVDIRIGPSEIWRIGRSTYVKQR